MSHPEPTITEPALKAPYTPIFRFFQFCFATERKFTTNRLSHSFRVKACISEFSVYNEWWSFFAAETAVRQTRHTVQQKMNKWKLKEEKMSSPCWATFAGSQLHANRICCWAPAPVAIGRYLLPVGRSAANPPAALLHGQTRGCIYYVGGVSNVCVIAEGKRRRAGGQPGNVVARQLHTTGAFSLVRLRRKWAELQQYCAYLGVNS